MLEWLRNHRRRQAEWMDEAEADPRELARALRFIRGVNAALGYRGSVLRHLKRFARNWQRGERIRIIDLATGSADIPRAILRWAGKAGFDVRIVAVERHGVTARAAAEGRDARLDVVRADVFELPFEDGAFDYALTAMFLHHLDEERIVRVLKLMDRLAVRGIIAADLLRHRRARLWIRLLTLLASRMVRHDARASVAQALTRDEVLTLREKAGIAYARYYRHVAHRFALAGEKGAPGGRTTRNLGLEGSAAAEG